MEGKIIVFSGPSGSGKTTIAKSIVETFPNMAFSVSATTRPKRPHEEDGRDYFFLTKDEFEKKIQDGAFIEYESVWGNYYGTLKDKTDEQLLQKKTNLVFDIEVHGGMAIKNIYKQKALLIFVLPPSMEILEKRLRDRKTESNDVVQQRLKRAEYEISYSDKYDQVIVNEALSETLLKVEEIIKIFI